MRTAIITGAYGAIGKAIARGVAEKGYKLTITGRNIEALDACCSELIKETGNEHISWITADLSQERWIKTITDKWNGLLPFVLKQWLSLITTH